MFALWPGDWLNLSTYKPPTFGYGGQTAASEAGHIANTNVVCHCPALNNAKRRSLTFALPALRGATVRAIALADPSHTTPCMRNKSGSKKVVFHS